MESKVKLLMLTKRILFEKCIQSQKMATVTSNNVISRKNGRMNKFIYKDGYRIEFRGNRK